MHYAFIHTHVLNSMKFDLHTHCNQDPCDTWITYSVNDLVDKAASLRYTHVAITCHDHVVDITPYTAYAQDKGVTLIQGCERTIDGAHVLLYECSWDDIKHVDTLDKLRVYRKQYPGRVIIAAHPFYPGKSCIGNKIYEYQDCFDAVEHCFFYTKWFNLNKKAAEFSKRTGIPLVANGDIHDLSLMGRNYTESARSPLEAIKQRTVTVKSVPMTMVEFATLTFKLVFGRFIKQ